MPPSSPLLAAARLLDLPEVRDGALALSAEAGSLRLHEALRRRIPEASAESRVRGARANAALDGADFPVALVRGLVTGEREWPTDTTADVTTLRGAVQASAEAPRLAGLVRTAPAQVLARLHLAAATGLVSADAVGRPRQVGEPCGEFVELGPAPPAPEAVARLQGVGELVRDWAGVSRGSGVPVGLVMALVHAEIVVSRPFVHGNGLVARAMDRVLAVGLGLEGTGVAVPEQGFVATGATGYLGALAGYAAGGAAGVGLWCRQAIEAYRAGVAEGVRVCDAVRIGRSEGPS